MATQFSIGSSPVIQGNTSYAQGNNISQSISSTESTHDIKPVSGSSSSTKNSNDPNQNSATLIQTTGEMKVAEVRGDKFAPGEAFLIKTIEKANKALEGRYTTLQFSVHEKTKQISIKVMDKETGEVIREIPPEKALDMVARLWEMAGILVDEKR
jgi:flagellar protein FlaG